MDFHFKNKYPIGVDISTSSVKVFQFGPNKKGTLEIKGYSEVGLPKGVVVEEAILDTQTLSFIVRQAIDKPKYGAFSGNRIVAALPEAKSFVRVIHLPHMGDSEVDQAIPFEAESYIPVPIDQVYLDWQKLDEVNGRMEILLIATPKDTADKYLSVFDKMKFTVQALEVESQSVQRALLKKGDTESFLVADINDHKTNLVMIERGRLLFTSSIPMGGNQFSEVLAKTLGIPVEKAEKIKVDSGLNNTPENPNIKLSMLPILKNLSAEIKNVLSFQKEHFQVSIDKVILCGGGARLKGIQENLQLEFQELNMKVELANPLASTGIEEVKMISPEESLDFTTAIGLALRTDY